MTAKRIYFFSGTQYCRFDEKTSGVSSFYPQDIAARWPGLPAGPIDAALYWGNNQAYFFVADQYYRWDIRNGRVMPNYPKPIRGNWPGFDGTGFENGVDDAVNWGNGKIYFFKGDQYLRVDVASGAVDPLYPRPISLAWTALAGIGWDRDLDAVINRGNGKAYFFKGSQYVRYDIAADIVDAGYPKAIAGNWGGVFSGGVSCATEWPFARVDPGGLRAPVNSTGWVQTATTGGSRWSIHFDMETDFVGTTYPEACAVGEYRQEVRGSFVRDGVRINHPLANPTPGGPALTMRPRPAAGAAADDFREDGLDAPGPGMNVWYGHRDDLVGNADTSTTYLPDVDTGCQFRGNDTPGMGGATGHTFSVSLDFRARAIDRATSDEVLQEIRWNVSRGGTF